MELILSENTAYDYSLESSYYSYIENRIQQELRINQLISECSILNEANTGLMTKTKKIAALHEAGIGEKIKNGFNKFIEFMKNLFGKLSANLTKILADEQTYLEKYKDIILKRPGSPDIKVSYNGNYEKGIKRITQVAVPPFDWQRLNESLSKKEDDIAYSSFFKINFVQGLESSFNYDATEKISDQFKNYFIGSEDGQQEKTMADMSLADMYAFCHDYKSLDKVFKKDQSNLESSINKITNAINSQKITSESYTEYYLSEADDNTNNEENKKAGDSGLQMTDTSSTNKVSSAAGTLDKEHDAEQQQQNAEKQVAAGMKDQDGKELTDAQSAIQLVVNRYQTIVQGIITAKMTACEQICKDYMKIINMHVKSHIGKAPEAGGGKTNGTRYTSDSENKDKFKDNGANQNNDNAQQQTTNK